MVNLSKADKFDGMDTEWTNKMVECPVYHPSKQQFEDPFAYLQIIAPEASNYGICKIMSPLSPSVPAGTVLKKETRDFKFTTNVQPLCLAKWGATDGGVSFFLRGRYYTLRDFETMANKAFARKYCVSGCLPSSFVEKEFWKEMARGKKGTVEYGINVEGSAFSLDPHDELGRSKWNLKTLPRQPKSALRLLQTAIPGVTDPMLYIGMLFSMFGWHVEDHYLYSINYHHCGAPKTWYGVPGHAAPEFERVTQHYMDRGSGEDRAFDNLMEKTTMFPPNILLQQGVPVCRAVQWPGEFVITFPRSYHSGFSHGFNCGEAVNFAFGDWFQLGFEASKRYALLGRTPIVPYEELLCKEAMLLSKSSNQGDTHTSLMDSTSAHSVKVSFAFLMRLHQCACWVLKRLGATMTVPPNPQATVFCALCKRECYAAYFTCSCHGSLICFFHEIELYNCPCQSKRTIFVRGDISEMATVAKTFEQEAQVLQAVKQKVKQEGQFWMQNMNIIPSIKDKYHPSCKESSGQHQDLERLNRLRRTHIVQVVENGAKCRRRRPRRRARPGKKTRKPAASRA